MPIFASAFRIDSSQQTYYARAEKRAHKRRRLGDANDQDSNDRDSDDSNANPNSDSDAPGPSSSRVSVRSTLHVSKTDPYYVAGLSRAADPPPPPFPHAAAKTARRDAPPVEDELARLRPPVYAYREGLPHRATPFRRRHADNLTAILHKCMLEGDWSRASRAWSLLLRTELGGSSGFDVRRHGRWSIGAELLLRCQDDGDDDDEGVTRDAGFSSIKGFELAREYYERLALQYPSTRWTQHRVNAESIYPALFSTWVYHIQARVRLIRRGQARQRSTSFDTGVDEDDDEQQEEARRVEFDGAEAIASRLDELLVGPPFDRSIPLLRLRGFVGLWIADLCDAADRESPGLHDDRTQRARDERRKGIELLSRVRAAGHDIGVAIPEDDEDSRSASMLSS